MAPSVADVVCKGKLIPRFPVFNLADQLHKVVSLVLKYYLDFFSLSTTLPYCKNLHVENTSWDSLMATFAAIRFALTTRRVVIAGIAAILVLAHVAIT